MQSDWVRSGGSVSLEINFDHGALTYDTQLPNAEAVAAVLHWARPLLLQKEPASFVCICGLVGKRLRDPYITSFLKSVRRGYSSEHSQSILVLKGEGPDPQEPAKPLSRVLNSFPTLLYWLNAHEYHRDQDKQARLEAVTRLLPPDAAKAVFLDTLAEALQAVLRLGDLVAFLTGHESKLVLRVPRPPQTST